MTNTTTIRSGTTVRWPPAPSMLAQVEQVLRSRVRLFYRCRTGRIRRPLVRLDQLSIEPMLVHNPFGRAERTPVKKKAAGVGMEGGPYPKLPRPPQTVAAIRQNANDASGRPS